MPREIIYRDLNTIQNYKQRFSISDQFRQCHLETNIVICLFIYLYSLPLQTHLSQQLDLFVLSLLSLSLRLKPMMSGRVHLVPCSAACQR